MSTTISRRNLVKSAAWATPAITFASVTPAMAASPTQSGAERGLFVSAGLTNGNFGYASGDDIGPVGSLTPQEYFAYGPAGGPNDNCTLNWSEGNRCATTTSHMGEIRVTHGTGAFTPVTNGETQTAGSYHSSSGFWFSLPTTAPYTGTGYINGSTATLKAGSCFTTQVFARFPGTAEGKWTAGNIIIGPNYSKNYWTQARSGRGSNRNLVVTADRTRPQYLGYSTTLDWESSCPRIWQDPDTCEWLFSGTIVATVKNDITIPGTKRKQAIYGQVIFMPSTIKVVGVAYGVNNFQLTSEVTNATITYTVPEGYAPVEPTKLTNTLIATTDLRYPC